MIFKDYAMNLFKIRERKSKTLRAEPLSDAMVNKMFKDE